MKADGQTPLHIAAGEGDENIVKCLHSLHADPNIPGNLFIGASHNISIRRKTVSEKRSGEIVEIETQSSAIKLIETVRNHMKRESIPKNVANIE